MLNTLYLSCDGIISKQSNHLTPIIRAWQGNRHMILYFNFIMGAAGRPLKYSTPIYLGQHPRSARESAYCLVTCYERHVSAHVAALAGTVFLNGTYETHKPGLQNCYREEQEHTDVETKQVQKPSAKTGRPTRRVTGWCPDIQACMCICERLGQKMDLNMRCSSGATDILRHRSYLSFLVDSREGRWRP